MTTTMVSASRAPDLLFGSEEEAFDKISKAVDGPQLMGKERDSPRLTSRPRSIVAAQVARAILNVIDLDLGDLLLAGWKKHDALKAAADQSLAGSGGEQLVDLATHTITSSHAPHVEILVDDVPVARVDIELRVEFLLKAVVASITNGRLTGVRSGLCDATGALTVLGQEIARRQATVDLGLSVQLRNDIPLG